MPQQIYTAIKSNETIQCYKMCETCGPMNKNANVDCINHDKFDKLITYLHQSVETNKQVSKIVEGEKSSRTYLIQTMNSDLVKLRVKRDNVIDINIQNEITRLKDRMNILGT